MRRRSSRLPIPHGNFPFNVTVVASAPDPERRTSILDKDPVTPTRARRSAASQRTPSSNSHRLDQPACLLPGRRTGEGWLSNRRRRRTASAPHKKAHSGQTDQCPPTPRPAPSAPAASPGRRRRADRPLGGATDQHAKQGCPGWPSASTIRCSSCIANVRSATPVAARARRCCGRRRPRRRSSYRARRCSLRWPDVARGERRSPRSRSGRCSWCCAP